MPVKHRTSNVVTSFFTYIIWLVTLPPLFCICFLLVLLPASIRYDNRLYFAVSTLISRIMIHATTIPITVHGRQNLPLYPQQPAIFVFNHSSALDIPLAEIILGTYPHVWISKQAYRNIPIFGFMLSRMHVMVDTLSRRDGYVGLVAMLSLLKNKPRHAVLFPEGKRHNDGAIHDFFPGFAVLAKKLQRPVIPVTISGMHSIFPKKSFVIDSFDAAITITIGQPMYYNDQMDITDFVTHVRQYFEKNMPQA